MAESHQVIERAIAAGYPVAVGADDAAGGSPHVERS